MESVVMLGLNVFKQTSTVQLSAQNRKFKGTALEAVKWICQMNSDQSVREMSVSLDDEGHNLHIHSLVKMTLQKRN